MRGVIGITTTCIMNVMKALYSQVNGCYCMMPKNNHDKEKKATHLYNEKYLNFAVKSTFKPCSPELNGKTLIGRITFSICDG